MEQHVKVSGKDANNLRIYDKDAAVNYVVESQKGNRAIDITIEPLTRSELSSMEELDIGRTRPGNIARSTPKSGVRLTTKVRTGTGRGGEYRDTKFVTSGVRGEYAAVDVKGTKTGESYDGDATVDYAVLSENIDAKSLERETALRIKIVPLTQKELWENRELDLSLTEPSGNFGRKVSRKMAECGVRMTITDGKYTETKIVKYF